MLVGHNFEQVGLGLRTVGGPFLQGSDDTTRYGFRLEPSGLSQSGLLALRKRNLKNSGPDIADEYWRCGCRRITPMTDGGFLRLFR